jgi:hypothetical protein
MGWDKKFTDPITWAAKIKKAPREAINIFAFEVFRRVVDRTPVDTGAARQNWLVTVNQENTSYDPNKKKGGRVLSKGQKAIADAKGDDTIIIQNNVPYIRMLEFGGYGVAQGQGKSRKGKPSPLKGKPSPLKGKTRIVKEKKPSKITADGFSLQAPQGMVGVTLAKADKLFEKALEIVKGNHE